jgi:phosphoribosylanthranilate isomerase
LSDPAGTRIKICGLARPEDARLAASLGADFLGLVLAESSRRVDPERARRWVPEVRAEFPQCRWVGVFVRPSEAEVAEAVEALPLDLVQIHGLAREESVAPSVPWIRAAGGSEAVDLLRRLAGSPGPPPWAVLVDHSSGAGGTGRSFDWNLLRDRSEDAVRLFVAGGLAADNVGRAIEAARPYAVDASSRLEISPGRKDPEKMRAFVAAVRGGIHE